MYVCNVWISIENREIMIFLVNFYTSLLILRDETLVTTGLSDCLDSASSSEQLNAMTAATALVRVPAAA